MSPKKTPGCFFIQAEIYSNGCGFLSSLIQSKYRLSPLSFYLKNICRNWLLNLILTRQKWGICFSNKWKKARTNRHAEGGRNEALFPFLFLCSQLSGRLCFMAQCRNVQICLGKPRPGSRESPSTQRQAMQTGFCGARAKLSFLSGLLAPGNKELIPEHLFESVSESLRRKKQQVIVGGGAMALSGGVVIFTVCIIMRWEGAIAEVDANPPQKNNKLWCQLGPDVVQDH